MNSLIFRYNLEREFARNFSTSLTLKFFAIKNKTNGRDRCISNCPYTNSSFGSAHQQKNSGPGLGKYGSLSAESLSERKCDHVCAGSAGLARATIYLNIIPHPQRGRHNPNKYHKLRDQGNLGRERVSKWQWARTG